MTVEKITSRRKITGKNKSFETGIDWIWFLLRRRWRSTGNNNAAPIKTVNHWSWVKRIKYALGPVITNAAQNIIQIIHETGAARIKKRPYKANKGTRRITLLYAASTPLNIDKNRTPTIIVIVANILVCELLNINKFRNFIID